jgi:hypothetical protein
VVVKKQSKKRGKKTGTLTHDEIALCDHFELVADEEKNVAPVNVLGNHLLKCKKIIH